ncbi:acylneuraminate cytidylyltransferase family protein [Alkalihalobacterium bogoriense]|uniref:acylneuraminate cytidylyltransferase family protein n=1 Tax=Alkalihalobacterium bogoriense TaxID=246272 RepID=UPI00047C9BA2|nr:acylneuraminate cytidylyltransferase family protein [Alkalihalobacterium bogoriense]
MSRLAIIPARSGSKGLKDKNIKLLNGKPLLSYTVEAARKSDIFDEIIVSTDSIEYANIAKKWGANVPFFRREELSSDTASSWDVVKEVIKEYKELGKEFSTVALLQPTSPLRDSNDIVKGFQMMKRKNVKAVVSVCEVEHSPLWCNTLPEDYSMANFLDESILNSNRQGLPTYYRINGALYIVKTDYLFSVENIYKHSCSAIIMSKEHSIDIDDDYDFLIAEALLSKKEINNKNNN